MNINYIEIIEDDIPDNLNNTNHNQLENLINIINPINSIDPIDNNIIDNKNINNINNNINNINDTIIKTMIDTTTKTTTDTAIDIEPTSKKPKKSLNVTNIITPTHTPTIDIVNIISNHDTITDNSPPNNAEESILAMNPTHQPQPPNPNNSTTNTAMSAMGEVLLNATKPPVNIKVVGVGGGGGNAVTHMIRSGVKNVTYITVNTDSQALYKTPADIKIQLGDNGQGAGANPNIARKYAEAARAQIKEALKGADMVFITAGLGKGTGTGASAVVAQVAQELEALTVCVVTKPFTSEGPGRAKLADAAADELELHSDSIIVILNSKLEARNPDGLMKEWYQAADDVLKNAVATIVEVIQSNGYQNVDFRDVRSVIASNRGRALMGTARASGVTRAKEAATAVINCDLLEEENLRTARGVLINITAAEDSMRGKEITEVIDTIRASFADDVTPIYGTTFDDAMGDEMQVTLIVSGIGSRGKVSLADTTRAAMLSGYSQGRTGDFSNGLNSLNNLNNLNSLNSLNSLSGRVRPTPALRTGTDDVMFNPSVGMRTDAFQDPMADLRAVQPFNNPAQPTPMTMPVGVHPAHLNNPPAPSIPTLTQEVDMPATARPAQYDPVEGAAMPAPATNFSVPPTPNPTGTGAAYPSPNNAGVNGGVMTDAASLMFNPSAMTNPKESQKIVTAMQASGIPNIDIPSFLRNQVN